ncbi:MAG TPA: hypothetical protein VM425_20095 [Myxococcota bacterium]|nr:hypothetical protein [Myxococcota bacterium]
MTPEFPSELWLGACRLYAYLSQYGLLVTGAGAIAFVLLATRLSSKIARRLFLGGCWTIALAGLAVGLFGLIMSVLRALQGDSIWMLFRHYATATLLCSISVHLVVNILSASRERNSRKRISLAVLALVVIAFLSFTWIKCRIDANEFEAWTRNLITYIEKTGVVGLYLPEGIDVPTLGSHYEGVPNNWAPMISIGKKDVAEIEGHSIQLDEDDGCKSVMKILKNIRSNYSQLHPNESFPGKLMLAADKDASWKSIATVSDCAARSGYNHYSVLFRPRQRSPVSKIEPSYIDYVYESLGDDYSDRMNGFFISLARACSFCPQLWDLLELDPCYWDENEINIYIINHYSEAIRACNCFLDIAALKKIAWEMVKSDWLTSIEIDVARDDDRDAVTVVFNALAPWSETSKKVLELAGAKKPLRFLVE